MLEISIDPTPENPGVRPLALYDFEMSLAHIYARGGRVADRFWEAVDTLGFEHARGLLVDAPRSYGALRRNLDGASRELLAGACAEAREAYLFRGLRPAPATMSGPLEAMREREAVALRHVRRILDRLFQQPDRAVTALVALARTNEAHEVASTLLFPPPDFGPTRALKTTVGAEQWRSVRAWARQRAMIDTPGALHERELQRFRNSLAKRFVDPAAAEALWRQEIRRSGPHRATHMLVTGTEELCDLARRPARVPKLRRHALMLAQSEAVAHASGIPSDMYAPPSRSVTAAAILCTDAARRREAGDLAADTYADIDHLQGLGGTWRDAREKLETAVAGCRTQLAGVVRDPSAVMWRLLRAPEQDQARMLDTLRTAPALAEREFGLSAALVESRGWWPLRWTPDTADAARKAPMAAAWLEHVATCTRTEHEARQKLAHKLGRSADTPDEVGPALDRLVGLLERRASELEWLRRRAERPSAGVDVGLWPPELMREVRRFVGPEALAAASAAPDRSPAREAIAR